VYNTAGGTVPILTPIETNIVRVAKLGQDLVTSLAIMQAITDVDDYNRMAENVNLTWSQRQTAKKQGEALLHLLTSMTMFEFHDADKAPRADKK
jgi:ATP-dependent RNA circularization protein (DNA/RNA ligase family)